MCIIHGFALKFTRGAFRAKEALQLHKLAKLQEMTWIPSLSFGIFRAKSVRAKSVIRRT